MNLTERLGKCYTGAVYDVLKSKGHSYCVLPSTIRPLDIDRKLAGRVFTVGGHQDDDADPHQTLLKWTEFLSQAPADSVIVCQPNDHELAFMGELSAETLQLRKVRGFIVDGRCRDSDFILRIGFQVFCQHFTPVDVVGKWLVDQCGEPIIIGQANIRSGDYILGDRDGVVVIPESIVEKVIDETEQVVTTESLVRKAIREGVDPQKAYLKYGKF